MAAPTRLPLRFTLLHAIALTAACNFPKPADVVGEAGPSDASASADAAFDSPSIDSPAIDAASDAPDPPGTAIRVSPTGDDANDGFIMPVKTLKHAIGLAAANSDIIHIVLASGRYSAATGETFPYTVPPNVTVIGPAGGGATLAGTNAEPGMSVNGSGLQDVDLADFTTAITATGTATLRNVRVLTSAIGLQAETAARVMASNLEIAGMAGACAKGIILVGSAQFTGAVFATRNLGTTLEARDHSVTNVANANISGDKACSQSLALFRVTSDASFALSDSLLDGGPNSGILVNPPVAGFSATVSSTTIRNMKVAAIGGGALVGGSMTFQMTGGEISNSANTAVDVGDGIWTFTNVMIRQNFGVGVYLQNAHLIMRGCMVTGNESGIDVFDNATADLGTSSSPGNNLLQGNTNVGLTLDGSTGATLVTAVGNTWNPDKQGTDHDGHYPMTDTVSMPVPFMSGNNFTINAGWSLSR